MIIEFIGDIFDLLLGKKTYTYNVWSLPLREAGLLLKLCPVS